MRIAFVSFETFHHRETEANERLQTLLELLRDHGHEVHCLCAQWWTGSPQTFEHEDITYHAVSETTDASGTFLTRLPFAIRSVRPDVVHVFSDPPEQVVTARVGATISRCPLVLEWYGDGTVTNDWWHRRAVSSANRIVTPSQYVQVQVYELGADSDRLSIVPSPVDYERIQSTPPAHSVDLVYTRRLDGDANLESLLLALAELRDRSVRTTVFGDGPERTMYERLARDLRIDDRVTFAGNVPLDERIAAYRAAHVFVQTARRCVFPTELLWAMASGCVGIVEYQTDSSAHELVEGWSRGFRTTSEKELVEALLEATELEHRQFDDSIGAFDRRSIANRYRDLYQSVLDGSP